MSQSIPLSDDWGWFDLGKERGHLTGEQGDATVGSWCKRWAAMYFGQSTSCVLILL